VISGFRLGRVLIGLDPVGVGAEPAEGLGLAGSGWDVAGAVAVGGEWGGVGEV
jgi:hypothetical protein